MVPQSTGDCGAVEVRFASKFRPLAPSSSGAPRSCSAAARAASPFLDGSVQFALGIMNNTRAPKQLGDFGEGLVTYLLIRKGFEVAYVDHVGADLIAERNGERWAVSVKLRLFKAGSAESKMVQVENDNLKKLQVFADRFAMQPAFAQVICEVDKKLIHAFLFKTAALGELLPTTQAGFSLGFGPKHLARITGHPLVDYSSWREEINTAWFAT